MKRWCSGGKVLKNIVKFCIVLQQGEIITMLGAEENTWKITATIRENTGNPNAVLLGNTTVQFINGEAVFSDLAISHFGTDYILDFTVSEPAVGEPFMIASKKFSLEPRPLVAAVQSKTPVIVESSAASITLELRDAVTGQVIDDIDWRVWIHTPMKLVPCVLNCSLIRIINLKTFVLHV